MCQFVCPLHSQSCRRRGGDQCVWVLCFCCQGAILIFVSVALKFFKTHLKVELLFLEGIERML